MYSFIAEDLNTLLRGCENTSASPPRIIYETVAKNKRCQLPRKKPDGGEKNAEFPADTFLSSLGKVHPHGKFFFFSYLCLFFSQFTFIYLGFRSQKEGIVFKNK